MKTRHVLLTPVVLLALACSSSTPEPRAAAEVNKDRSRAVAELDDAARMLRDTASSMKIPLAQRQRAKCVLVSPSFVSGGLLVGASHGVGVVTCRTNARTGWSGPAFVDLSGGSAGLQAGLKSSDMVMLVNSDRVMSKLFASALQLGVDASVAAGPVGEAAMAETDVRMDAELLTYAHSRGLFAGVDAGGVWVSQDTAASAALYGPKADLRAILSGSVPIPKEAMGFLDQVRIAFPSGAK